MSYMQWAHASIRGHLAEMPTLRRTSKGRPVANLRVITNRPAGGLTSSDSRNVPLVHFVVVFGEDAERVAHAQTGDQVMVVGEIAQSVYTPDDGVRRYKTEILVSPGFGCISVTARKRAAETDPDDLLDQAHSA